MLWEIWNDIRRYFKMTFIPAMRNLFASKRALAGLIFAMTVLQMILSVLCICGVENIKTQFTVLNEFNNLIDGASGVINSYDGSYMMSDTFTTGMSGVSIFIGAICLWAVCAVTVYQKITSASADRDKYIWGMYVTHGAKLKKIRSILKCELYAPHLLATVIAYPTALLLCNNLFKSNGYTYSVSPITLAVIIILSYACIRLVVEYECFLIKRMTCMDMLRNEDSPKSICFPKKFSRLISGFTTGRYASSTFFRMRRYYASIAIVAAIPAMLLVCLQVSVVSQDSYLASDINEFAINFRTGVTEEELASIKKVYFSDINGISSINTAARYHAAKLHTHLLTDEEYLSNTESSPFMAQLYGDNVATISRNDRAFKQLVGYNAAMIKQGEVLIVYPDGERDYDFKEGDRLFLAISKLDGSIRTVDSTAISVLENDLKEDYDYLELKVARTAVVSRGKLSTNGFLKAEKTYFLLSDHDYETVTSIAPDSFVSYVSYDSFTYTQSLSSLADFTVSIPTEKLTAIPSAGDCIKIRGKATVNISLENVNVVGKKEPMSFNDSYDVTFEYTYINSVIVNGDTTIINVSPRSTAIMLSDSYAITPVAVLLGTPSIPNTENLFCASYPAENLKILGGSVKLDEDETITVNTSSAISTAEVGTHILAKGGSQISNTQGRLPIASLFADNSFVLAVADKTTTAADGLTVSSPVSGTVTVVLPSSKSNYYNFKKEQQIYIAKTLENASLYDDSAILPGGMYDTLSEEIKQNYAYLPFTVAEVIYSDTVADPIVYTSPDDMEELINKRGAYTWFTISLDSGIQSSQYATIRDKVAKWSTLDTHVPSVKSTGKYLEFLLRKSSNYASAVKLISILIPIIVPFIWYYPLSTLFDRRKNEIGILQAIGKKRTELHLSFLKEGCMVTLTAFLAVLIACYPSMLIFKIVGALAKLPLEFEYAFLTPGVLLSAAAFSAICAGASFVFCYSTTLRSRKPLK